MTVRVVYRGGAFVPQGECDLEEGVEGLVVVGPSDLASEHITDPGERRRLLSELVASMRENPLLPGSPRLTCDQMRERH
jgi:hypothetical protein